MDVGCPAFGSYLLYVSKTGICDGKTARQHTRLRYEVQLAEGMAERRLYVLDLSSQALTGKS
jgi:hypothetical protein